MTASQGGAMAPGRTDPDRGDRERAAGAVPSDGGSAPGLAFGDPASFAFEYLRRSTDVMRSLPVDGVATLIEVIRTARDAGRQLFVCGNGGSAATASHFASGLGKDGSYGRDQRFRALALTDNVAWITSLANDVDYADIFVEQLKNFAEPADVLIAFSSSGNSPNVLRAVDWANERGLVTVGITGGGGGRLHGCCRHPICVASDHIGHVEEAHFLLQHLVTYYFLQAER